MRFDCPLCRATTYCRVVKHGKPRLTDGRKRRRECGSCKREFWTVETAVPHLVAPTAEPATTAIKATTPLARLLRKAAGTKTTQRIAEDTGVALEIVDGIMVGRIKIIRRVTASLLERGLRAPGLAASMMGERP